MKFRLTFVTTLLLGVVLVGCGEAKQPAAQVSIANPASEYCISLNGSLIIEMTAEGEHGVCTLPNGETIEEWALFRRDHKAEKPQ
ncbi:putative hemolysin [Shewanella glacialipiscicola]|uniref:putative hemolysin n=1 Tax=Shewanella glacialipiscicola TaxID=614069 RepID=UPI003D7A1510